ncbi:MAG: adenylate/guanylate cyclase domain-containing protein [bacterium]
MSPLVDLLATYVPSVVVRHYLENPSVITAPYAHKFSAAVLLADISGFTPLTERLAQRGPAGVEELSRVLNTYFGDLIAMIAHHGGEVVHFFGDAPLVLWPVQDKDLDDVSRRALRCAFELLERFNDQQVSDDCRLCLKIGAGAGEVLASHVGGMDGRWHFLLSGGPLMQVSAAESRAQPGEIILSPQTWSLVKEHAEGEPLPDGYMRLQTPGAPGMILALPPLAVNPRAETALRAYVPEVVIARLEAGQAEWLSELRQVTVLFVRVMGPGDCSSSPDLDQVQKMVCTIRTELRRYKGTLLQSRMEAGGTTFIAAFGLPPFPHDRVAVRGVEAALQITEKLQKSDSSCAVGVTTGRAFCGPIGNARRREYALHGDVVNLAARLMQAGADLSAAHANPVYCDAVTCEAVGSHVPFDRLPPFVLKGKEHPVAVYRPFELQKLNGNGSITIGRKHEIERLTRCLQALRKGNGQTLLLEGEPGIGKSKLVEELRRLAQRMEITTLVGAASAIESATPWYTWRAVFCKMFGLNGSTAPESRRDRVLQHLQEQHSVDLAPLVNPVLGLDLPENDRTAQMTGEVRAENTFDLLLTLVQKQASASPLLLILEDAHWMDTASWELALRIFRQVHPIALVIVTRPLPDPIPAAYVELTTASGVERLNLETLMPDESRRLVRSRLGLNRVASTICEFIYRRAEGNPFFIEELTSALLDADLIVVANGECTPAPGTEDLSVLHFPDTIQGVITNRIDQLTPAQQLTIKVASVIGRVFPYRVLYDNHPVEKDKTSLQNYLRTFDRLALTTLESPEPNLAYIFKHIITQQVAYNLLLYSQRQQLHQAIAEWYERAHAADLAPYYPLLAHHWKEAAEAEDAAPEIVHKAIEFLEKAGEQALHNFANREAITFINEALRLNARRDRKEYGLRRGRWHRQLCEAHYRVGEHTKCQMHGHRALALLDRKMPASRAGVLASLAGQIIRQVMHRFCPERMLIRRSAASEPLREAATAYVYLGWSYGFGGDPLRLAYSAFRPLNLLETIPCLTDLAYFRIVAGYIFGFAKLHGLADTYFGLADKTMSALGRQGMPALNLLLEAVYQTGIGLWAVSEKQLRQATELNRTMGDKRMWEQSSGCLANLTYYRGDFAQTLQLWSSVLASARRRGDPLAQSWALTWHGEIRLRHGGPGHAQEAISKAKAGADLLAKSPAQQDIAQAYAVLATAYLRQGDNTLAREAADRAGQHLLHEAPTAHYLLIAFAGLAEVYLSLWAAAQNRRQVEHKQLQKLACRACKALAKYANIFPIGKPRAWLWQGVYDWQAGKAKKARKSWQKSLSAAERLGMPYEQGLAHFEIGRHLDAGDVARDGHLDRACEIFQRLEVGHDLARAQTVFSA